MGRSLHFAFLVNCSCRSIGTKKPERVSKTLPRQAGAKAVSWRAATFAGLKARASTEERVEGIFETSSSRFAVLPCSGLVQPEATRRPRIPECGRKCWSQDHFRPTRIFSIFRWATDLRSRSLRTWTTLHAMLMMATGSSHAGFILSARLAPENPRSGMYGSNMPAHASCR